jgi:hypothetical protein
VIQVEMAALPRFAIALVLALGACAGSPAPTTMRTLSSLPTDPQRRNDELESAQARPGPERGKRSRTEQRVETTAATMAALVGSWFSKSANVVIGGGAPVDENQLVGVDGQVAPARDAEADANREPGPSTEPVDASALVPWVRVGPRTTGETPTP